MYDCDSNGLHISSGTVKNGLLTFPEMCKPLRHPGGDRSIHLHHCRQPLTNLKSGNFLNNKELHETALPCCTSACSIIILNSNANDSMQ